MSAPTSSEEIRLGTRGSRLAVAQSEMVAEQLRQATGRPVRLVTVTTHGDVTRASLASLGGTGVFATALREFLLAGEADLIVHSLKDLPVAPYPGLEISCVPRRADPRDVLCTGDGRTLDQLRPGESVGTGSPRRVAQVRSRRPDLEVVDLRGNIDTRLGKARSGELAGVILAAAGLSRASLGDAATEAFDTGDWPTAPGQGALAIETSPSAPEWLREALDGLNDPATELAVAAERAVLATLQARCAAPLGTVTEIDAAGALRLEARVYAPDGTRAVIAVERGELGAVPRAGRAAWAALESARACGANAARRLLADGAADIAPVGQGS